MYVLCDCSFPYLICDHQDYVFCLQEMNIEKEGVYVAHWHMHTRMLITNLLFASFIIGK